MKNGLAKERPKAQMMFLLCALHARTLNRSFSQHSLQLQLCIVIMWHIQYRHPSTHLDTGKSVQDLRFCRF